MTIITKNTDVAVNEILNGNVVALPTETVYGLGANGLNKNAVLKIFEIKERPKFNPLILHVYDTEDFAKYAKNIPDEVYRIAEIYSPGPITFVLQKKAIVPDIVTAGLNSVAIRIPAHKLIREVIKKAGVPIAAPSANMFGKISPVNASDVLNDMCGKINYILDGGECWIGIESTVLSFLNGEVKILRPGFVTQKDIEKIIGNKFSANHKPEKEKKILSPGMLKSHYAPSTPLYIIDGKPLKKYFNKKTGIIDFSKYKDIRSIASNLFKELRKIDDKKYDYAVVQKVENTGIGIAINDRIEKASKGYIKIVNGKFKFIDK